MRSMAIVILLPLMSVLILSLYVHGGASRIAGLVLLGLSVIGVLAAAIVRKPSPRQDC